MDDQSRAPGAGDRGPVRNRIRRAVADGRISAADGDIRLRNVESAQSIGELGLIVRDLDQLEAAIAPSDPASRGPSSVGSSTGGSRRSLVPVLVGAFALVVLGVAGAGFLAFGSGSGSSTVSGPELPDPVPITASPRVTEDPEATSGPGDDPAATAAAAAYRLSPQGVRTFIATYRERFGTTRTVSTTFYGDYVVVQVPVARNRHRGWIYRQASGFTEFGGTTANFPGSAVVDLRRLDVPALFANVSRARRVLRVQDAVQTYVTLDYRPRFDPAPNVNIYLTNGSGESGYLATRLDGQVERAYPFRGQ